MDNLLLAQKDPVTGHINFYDIKDKVSISPGKLSPVSFLYGRSSKRKSPHDIDTVNKYDYSVFAEEKIIWTCITGRWVWLVETYIDEDLCMICNPDHDNEDHSRHDVRIAFDATITVKQVFGMSGIEASVTAPNSAHSIWLPNVNGGLLCSGVDRNPYTLLSPTQLINMLNTNEGNMDYTLEPEYELDSLTDINEIEPQLDQNRPPAEFANIVRLNSIN